MREIVAELKARPGGGPELLAYREDGRWRDVKSADINAYLRDISGEEIKVVARSAVLTKSVLRPSKT